ncbi:dual specificity mitogen-activated protein kinase kinase 4-like isoform X2 [Amphiura filiformis]|uniref:dual specificity mitogen-activated protein kinase kinase 4-like isoform X2 n=1 Tax=Amphiura filiformis TaxID=82378 RepID=UPI003B20F4D3
MSENDFATRQHLLLNGTGGSGQRNRPRLNFGQPTSERFNHYGNGSHGQPQQRGGPNLRLDFTRLNINDSGAGQQQQQTTTSWVSQGARRQPHQPHQPHQPQQSHPTQILRYQNWESIGVLSISDQQYNFTAEDLEDKGLIGQGNFGSVCKMYHKSSKTIMAVKRIRSTVDEREQKQLLMDLDVVKRSSHCQYIIKFYGALFKEGDCWICMELMDTSFDKFYKFVFDKLKQRIPEDILGKVTVATLKALNYLKDELKIIHRDVKPSNILVDREGNIKMCDFGISGQLVDSIARTQDAGCRPYMAPERIDPMASRQGYDVRSDVWSLGITLSELATGKFPFRKWNSVFEQLAQVVKGDPPRIKSTPELNFNDDFVDFVSKCLTKDEMQRPKYKKLLDHPFIIRSVTEDVDVAEYVCSILDKMAESRDLLQ